MEERTLHAFIVGINRYAQAGWDVDSPCRNAIAVTNLLLRWQIDPSKIWLFLGLAEDALREEVDELEKRGVHLSKAPTHVTIDTFWRSELRNYGRDIDSSLLFYWSGHGCTDAHGHRVFFCSDYTTELTSRVFNCTVALRHLHSPGYQHWPQQLCLFDVCGNRVEVETDSSRLQPPSLASDIDQWSFFATPEGEYAKADDGVGVFTKHALEALEGFGGWPALPEYDSALSESFKAGAQRPFRLHCYNRHHEGKHEFIPSKQGGGRGQVFDEVFTLLAGFEVPDSTYRRHYLDTVSDLGEPGLYNAQGLTGMIEELASLGDARKPSDLSYGLIQFLVRLCDEESALWPSVKSWLDDHPSQHGNTIANIRKKIEAERRHRVFLVELTHDHRTAEISGFTLHLRSYDLNPLSAPVRIEGQAVGWDDFALELALQIARLEERYDLSDYEIQFLVDPPQFHHAFHEINTVDGQPLGNSRVVTIRYRTRAYTRGSILAEVWRDHEENLRRIAPCDLELFGISEDAGSAPGPVAPQQGFCYLEFPIGESLDMVPSNSDKKKTILQLLNEGVPYLLWLHRCRASDGTSIEIEPALRVCLDEVTTLDKFPRHFTKQRLYRMALASGASLLWDTHLSFPLIRNRGVTAR